MAKKPSLLDLSNVDFDNVLLTQEDIRKYNPHRYEMELLTGIVYEDNENSLYVAYQDVTDQAFWYRGHMPGFPLMPGVLICETAAQVASCYATKDNYLTSGVVGLGGLDNVKFRGIVRPGDRLVVIVKICKVRHKMMQIVFEAVVNGDVIAEGEIKGVAIPTETPEKK
ncbi:MAG: 3-hydroxyacyl-ACP dehydratase FabZ family protein [Planctomycetia bacterium]|nr:3-hydroxyacyl-ACP dehydratase FabZ family protein [Planctomycetia bacterium]